MEYSEFRDALRSGAFDKQLFDIEYEAKRRREVAQQEELNKAGATAKVGDLIVFERTRPKALSGYRGTITGKQGDRFVIRLEHPYEYLPEQLKRYVRPGGITTAPAGIFRVVQP